MTTEQQSTGIVTTMTGSPRRRRSTFYIPLQATARPVLAVARLVDAVAAAEQTAAPQRQQQKLTGGRALSASALALLQPDHHPASNRPPSSPSSSRRSSPLAFIRRPSSRKLARSSSTIITTGRWLSSKATGPLRINCSGDSTSSIGGDTSVVQQANRSPPIIAIEGSPDEFYRRRRRKLRRADGDRSDSDGDDDDEDDDDDNLSGQCLSSHLGSDLFGMGFLEEFSVQLTL